MCVSGWWLAAPLRPPLGQQGAPAFSLGDLFTLLYSALPPGPCWLCPQPDAVLKAFSCFSGISLNIVTNTEILLEKHMAESGTPLASCRGDQLDRCSYFGHLGSVGAVLSSVPCPRTAGSRGPSQPPLPCGGSSLEPRWGESRAAWRGPWVAPRSQGGVSAAPAAGNTVYERCLCPLGSCDGHGRWHGVAWGFAETHCSEVNSGRGSCSGRCLGAHISGPSRLMAPLSRSPGTSLCHLWGELPWGFWSGGSWSRGENTAFCLKWQLPFHLCTQ